MKPKCDDEYYPPETIVTEKSIVTIRRPILTPEERERRMKLIHDAAVRLWLSSERARMNAEREAKANS